MTYRTIETRISHAETVIVGTIAKTVRKLVVPVGDVNKLDGIVEYTLTVKVRESLKGEAKETHEVVSHTSAMDRQSRPTNQ